MKSARLCMGVILLMAMTGRAQEDEVYGTWRLVSLVSKVIATGETEELLGKAPHGFLHYDRDGRMMVLMVKDERPKPAYLERMTDQERANLFRTMVAYAGTFTFDGKTVTHHIDVSWNELWTGTNQQRNVKLDGRKLIISTNPQPNPVNGKMSVDVLTWEKVE